MGWPVWVGVALLGSLGALARFAVNRALLRRNARGLLAGTLTVNLSGAFALGLVTGLAFSGNAALLVGSATIGSYTTFSTWVFETQRLHEDGETAAALANILVSVFVGLGAAALGRTIGAHL
jgi:fluoride exporter